MARAAKRSDPGNAEYIKNIVLRYAENPHEHTKLFPVLSTVLHLSPSEVDKVTQARKSGRGQLFSFF